MPGKRREFLKLAGLTGLTFAGEGLKGFALEKKKDKTDINNFSNSVATNNQLNGEAVSVIGLYGAWASSLHSNKLPGLSFRNGNWKNVERWRTAAKHRLVERMAIPDIGALPNVKIDKQYSFDGLHIEELRWQLPYGRATDAVLLKPANAKGKLPGILAFHDHSGDKYFGWQKIVRTSDSKGDLMKEHQQGYYSGFAWANEIAKRGYAVLVSDAFTFGSRRVMLRDVPDVLRKGVNDDETGNPDSIRAYNDWAGEHEHVMAKSLFCAGITWPAVFFAEDQKALDILCAREDVDANRIGCGGLSGGGLRTVFMAGLDSRIKCCVDVGFMTTWNDFLLNKSFNHTWMAYVPLLANELDFPEILSLRTPLPTLVLNNSEDQLYTLPEMNRAEQILQEVYQKAGAEKNFKCSYYPGPHKFDLHMQAEAFEWFDRWLKT